MDERFLLCESKYVKKVSIIFIINYWIGYKW